MLPTKPREGEDKNGNQIPERTTEPAPVQSPTYTIGNIKIFIGKSAGDVVIPAGGTPPEMREQAKIFSDAEINLGKFLMAVFHPMADEKVLLKPLEDNFNEVTGCFRKKKSNVRFSDGMEGWGGGGRMSPDQGAQDDEYEKIGDGNPHTDQELSYGLRRWKRSPWSGEVLIRSSGGESVENVENGS